MDFGLGFLSEYISAAELVGKTPTLTINKVTLEKVESMKEDSGGKMKDRIVIYFSESKTGRGWLLNKTNALCLVELWGRETQDWLGHKVTLFVTNVRVGPKIEPAIRVKGSPELPQPITFDLRLPRKKPIPTTLVPTGKPAATPKPPQDQPPTLSDVLALHRSGDEEGAQSLRELLSEDDQARFDIEVMTPETTA